MRSLPLLLAAALAGGSASALPAGDSPKVPIPSDYRRAFGATMHEGKAQAECAFLRAEFDGEGAHLLLPEGIDGFAPALDLRLLGVSRSGGAGAAGPVLEIAVEGPTVSLARGLVTETYEIREDGLEQVVVVEAPLPGTGDLVARYRVSTPLLSDATGPARPGPLVFSGPAGPAVRYGEATAIDGAGRRAPVATGYDGVSTLELVVPAAFVDSATYPLTIDPIVAPAFVIDPANAAFSDVSPDVAFTEGTFLVVWERVIGAGDHRLRARRYDEDGAALGALILVDPAASLSESPSVAGDPSNANEFLVAWQDSTDGGTTYDIRARHVDGDDGSMDAEFTIASAGAGEKLRRPAVGGEGDGGTSAVYFVAWDKTLAGDTQAREIWWSMRGATPAFVYVGATLLSAVPAGDYVLDAEVSSLDSPGGPDSLAWRVVWSRFFDSPLPGDFDVHTACVKYDGVPGTFTLLDSAGALAGANAIGTDEHKPDVAEMDDEFLVVYEEDQEIHARRMDNATTLGLEIVIQAAQSFDPCVAAGDCEYSVGYLLADPDEFDLDTYAARVLPDGALGEPETLLEDPGNVYQDAMAAAGMHAENRAMFVWRSQQPVSGNNDIHAILYRPLAGVLSSFGAGCPGPAGIPTLTGSGDPHPDTTFTATLSGAPAFAATFLGIGVVDALVPIPGTVGCLLLVVPIFVAPGAADAAGITAWSFPIPCDPGLDGATVHLQGAVFVPGFNPASLVTSNRLTLTWTD